MFLRILRRDDIARVVPEPSAEERKALLAALAAARSEDQTGLDPWTAAALREATDQEHEQLTLT